MSLSAWSSVCLWCSAVLLYNISWCGFLSFSLLEDTLCFVNLIILVLLASGHFQPSSLWIVPLSYYLTPSRTLIRNKTFSCALDLGFIIHRFWFFDIWIISFISSSLLILYEVVTYLLYLISILFFICLFLETLFVFLFFCFFINS